VPLDTSVIVHLTTGSPRGKRFFFDPRQRMAAPLYKSLENIEIRNHKFFKKFIK
jgi:hypothetical protein